VKALPGTVHTKPGRLVNQKWPFSLVLDRRPRRIGAAIAQTFIFAIFSAIYFLPPGTFTDAKLRFAPYLQIWPVMYAVIVAGG